MSGSPTGRRARPFTGTHVRVAETGSRRRHGRGRRQLLTGAGERAADGDGRARARHSRQRRNPRPSRPTPAGGRRTPERTDDARRPHSALTHVALSALVALALSVVPLPTAIDALRPDFPSPGGILTGRSKSPRAGGLGLAFFGGPRRSMSLQGMSCWASMHFALTLMAAWATNLQSASTRLFHAVSQSLTIFAHVDRLSVRAVLGGRCHRQSRRHCVQPLARARHGRPHLAAGGGNPETLADER